MQKIIPNIFFRMFNSVHPVYMSAVLLGKLEEQVITTRERKETEANLRNSKVAEK